MDAEARRAFSSVEGSTTAATLFAKHLGRQREPVIDGLIRKGEVATIVAPAKSGKTWLTYNLALCLVAGVPFLRKEWVTKKGPVAIIDNEQHEETIGSRVVAVQRSLGLDDSILNDTHIVCLRGHWKPLLPEPGSEDSHKRFMTELRRFREIAPSLMVFDALYRFLPQGTSENDNAAVVRVYNQLDWIAEEVGCPILVVHHTGKGSHADKAVVDVGRGASAFAGASDCFMIIREHEMENHFVIEARLKSFKQPEPIVVRWEYPRWVPEEGEDPTLLKGKITASVALGNSITTDELVEILRGNDSPGGISATRARNLLRVKYKNKAAGDAAWTKIASMYDFSAVPSGTHRDFGNVRVFRQGPSVTLKYLENGGAEK